MTDTRTAYIKNLFDLATTLDNSPDLPIPYSLDNNGLLWYIHEPIEDVLAIRALMTDAVTVPYNSNNFPVEVTGKLAGFAVSVLVAREIALEGAPTYPPSPMNPRLLAPTVVGAIDGKTYTAVRSA